MSLTVDKNTLIEEQLSQIKLLKNNLEQIKARDRGFFPIDLQIEEGQDSFKFIYQDLVQEDENRSDFVQLFGIDNNRDKFTPMILIRLMDTLINLSNFGIHLVLLNISHFIDTGVNSIYFSQNTKVRIFQFGIEELKRDNKKLICNTNIPYEIINGIIEGNISQIQFNEKMTVHVLGCIIYDIYTCNSVFQRQYNDSKLNYRNNNIMNSGLQGPIYQELKDLILNCTSENPEERPTLIELRRRYLEILIQRGSLILLISSIAFDSINLITESIIAPNELITGRLCIMEFFTKIKFIYKFFNESNQKMPNNQIQNAKNDSDTMILLLIDQELDKLKVDQQDELTQWDEDNTKDEIYEFKKKYLGRYNEILNKAKNQLKNQQSLQFQSLIGDSQILLQKKIGEIKDQYQNTRNISQIICLEKINSIFKYRYLLEYFQPIQAELIKTTPYLRYDILLNCLFKNHKQVILDKERVGRIRQRI